LLKNYEVSKRAIIADLTANIQISLSDNENLMRNSFLLSFISDIFRPDQKLYCYLFPGTRRHHFIKNLFLWRVYKTSVFLLENTFAKPKNLKNH
jgi:hypothetical protein